MAYCEKCGKTELRENLIKRFNRSFIQMLTCSECSSLYPYGEKDVTFDTENIGKKSNKSIKIGDRVRICYYEFAIVKAGDIKRRCNSLPFFIQSSSTAEQIEETFNGMFFLCINKTGTKLRIKNDSDELEIEESWCKRSSVNDVIKQSINKEVELSSPFALMGKIRFPTRGFPYRTECWYDNGKRKIALSKNGKVLYEDCEYAFVYSHEPASLGEPCVFNRTRFSSLYEIGTFVGYDINSKIFKVSSDGKEYQISSLPLVLLQPPKELTEEEQELVTREVEKERVRQELNNVKREARYIKGSLISQRDELESSLRKLNEKIDKIDDKNIVKKLSKLLKHTKGISISISNPYIYLILPYVDYFGLKIRWAFRIDNEKSQHRLECHNVQVNGKEYNISEIQNPHPHSNDKGTSICVGDAQGLYFFGDAEEGNYLSLANSLMMFLPRCNFVYGNPFVNLGVFFGEILTDIERSGSIDVETKDRFNELIDDSISFIEWAKDLYVDADESEERGHPNEVKLYEEWLSIKKTREPPRKLVDDSIEIDNDFSADNSIEVR